MDILLCYANFNTILKQSHKNSIRYNISRSSIITLIASIPVIMVDRVSISMLLAFILILAIITNIGVNRDIIVNFVEIILSTALALLVQLISLGTFIGISYAFFDG